MNKLKSQISIIKEPKIVNSWDQKDTQSLIKHDDRCIKSSSIKNVEYNGNGIPIGVTLVDLGGYRIEKLKLITKNYEKN